MTTKEFAKILQDKLTSEYGVDLSVASNQQIYRSLALICRQMMSENHKKFQSKAIGTGSKQVYYLCMEFLMGRSLKTSLLNLGLDEVAKKALSDADINVAGGYLLKSVRNRCLNHIRDCEIHQRIANRYFLDNEEYDTEDWPDDETIARIYALIKSDISSQARKVMELRFSEGMPFARIAAAMGISETAVYRHLSHALTVIRQKLNENEQ